MLHSHPARRILSHPCNLTPTINSKKNPNWLNVNDCNIVFIIALIFYFLSWNKWTRSDEFWAKFVLGIFCIRFVVTSPGSYGKIKFLHAHISLILYIITSSNQKKIFILLLPNIFIVFDLKRVNPFKSQVFEHLTFIFSAGTDCKTKILLVSSSDL